LISEFTRTQYSAATVICPIVMRKLVQESAGQRGDTLDVRIAAVFVIFVAGLIGCLPPLYIESFRNARQVFSYTQMAKVSIPLTLATAHRCTRMRLSTTRPPPLRHPTTLLFRALSAGVILSLALLHVIPDGVWDLEVGMQKRGGCSQACLCGRLCGWGEIPLPTTVG